VRRTAPETAPEATRKPGFGRVSCVTAAQTHRRTAQARQRPIGRCGGARDACATQRGAHANVRMPRQLAMLRATHVMPMTARSAATAS